MPRYTVAALTGSTPAELVDKMVLLLLEMQPTFPDPRHWVEQVAEADRLGYAFDLNGMAEAQVTVDVPEAQGAVDVNYFGLMGRALNGINALEPQAITVKYTAESMAVLIPQGLIEPSSLYVYDDDLDIVVPEGVHIVARPQAPPDGTMYLRTSGLSPCDVGVLSHDGHWARHGNLRTPDAAGDWDPRLTALSMATIAALNLELCGNEPLVACRLALAAGLGLINYGDDQFKREWIPTKRYPVSQSVRMMLEVFLGPEAHLHANLLRDLIAFVGFTRVTDTHIFNSADQAIVARQVALINRIRSHIVPGAAFRLDDPRVCSVFFWSSVHCFSMTGAVGYARWWISREEASPYLRVRDTFVGDAGKSIYIVDAGMTNLAGVPLMNTIVNIKLFRDARAVVDAYKARVVANPTLTSTLSPLLTGLATVAVDPASLQLMKAVGTVLCAGCLSGMLPQSLGASYFLKKVLAEMPGTVSAWQRVFERIDTTMSETEITDLVSIIADTMGAR